MKNVFKRFGLILSLFVLLSSPIITRAIEPSVLTSNMDIVAGSLKTSTDLKSMISTTIGIVLGLLGIIFFLFILYSGYQWMTSQGNEEEITTAKERIINSVIGLAIVLAAYAITNFVVSNLVNATK